MSILYVENPAGMARFERDNDIKKEMQRRGENVAARARANATGIGVQGIPALGIPGPKNPLRRGPRVVTGRLIGSIATADGTDNTSVYVDIGTNVFYGAFLEGRNGGLRNGNTYPFISVALVAAAT
jgi:hypothetical protein